MGDQDSDGRISAYLSLGAAFLNGTPTEVGDLDVRGVAFSGDMSLEHPNAVSVHHVFEEDGLAYIAMDYFPGGLLRLYTGTVSRPQTNGVLYGFCRVL